MRLADAGMSASLSGCKLERECVLNRAISLKGEKGKMELPLKTAAAENKASSEAGTESRSSGDIRGRHGLKDMMEQLMKAVFLV